MQSGPDEERYGSVRQRIDSVREQSDAPCHHVEVIFSMVTGSVALFADGVDSLSDASVSFFVWTGLHFVRRRPSKKFPFGYYKVESLTALIAALILVAAASFIFSRSYRALLSPKPPNFLPAALAVLLVTGLVSLYRALQ